MHDVKLNEVSKENILYIIDEFLEDEDGNSRPVLALRSLRETIEDSVGDRVEMSDEDYASLLALTLSVKLAMERDKDVKSTIN